MELIPYKDDLLHSVLEPFDFNNPPVDPGELATELVEFMRSNNGIGLSANQVGLTYRVFAMEGEPAFVCFNPRVVLAGSNTVTLEEGCLSYPGLLIKVKRPRDVKVRFQGPDGDTYTKTFTGMSARVFQHELDHLDGVTMLERANRHHRESALKKWKIYKRRNET